MIKIIIIIEEEEEEKNIEGRKERRHSLLYSLLHYNIYTGLKKASPPPIPFI